MNTFRQIFRRAFALSISRFHLIILGVVAFFGATYSFVDSALSQVLGVVTTKDLLGDLIVFYQGDVLQPLNGLMSSALTANRTLSQMIIIAAGICVLIYITTLAHTALVLEIKAYLLKKKNTLQKSLLHAHSHIIDVVTITLLSRVVMALGLLIAAAPLALAYALSRGELTTVYFFVILFVLLFIPVSICVSLMSSFAVIARVTAELNFMDALRQAYRIIRKNTLVAFELALALAGLQLLVYLVFVSFAGIIFIPVAFALGSLLLMQQTVIFSLLLGVMVILSVCVSALILGWYHVMYTSVMVVAYNEMSQENLTSKLTRILTNALNSLLPNVSTKEALNKISSGVNTVSDSFADELEELAQYIDSLQNNFDKEVKILAPKVIAASKKAVKDSKPVVKKAGKQLASDIEEIVTYAKPLVEKGISNLNKNASPYLKRIKDTIEKNYADELEKELSKLFSTPAPVAGKKKGVKKRKIAKRK